MNAAESDLRRRSARIDVAFVAILLLALAFRLFRLDSPLVDAHSWRQITNADIARHFAEGSLNPFLPRVSWGEIDGVVGMEFPLLQWITGLLWRFTGEHATVARLVALAFSLATVPLMYLLGRRLLSPAAGRAAAFLTAISPGLVFFGRSFLSDTPMLMFSVGAVLAWDWYLDAPVWRRAVLAAGLTALAGLVKLPAILVLGAIAGLAWSRIGWKAFTNRGLVVGIAAALLCTAAWYGYADLLYQRTGLTQAVFRPSGTYPPDIAPGVTFATISHFSTAARLFSAEYWREIGDRLWNLYLTPIGALAAILGCGVACTRPKGWTLHLWTLAGLALVVVAAEGQYWHEFHTLPLVPPLLLYGGLALAPVFDGAMLRTLLPWPTGLRQALVAITCAVLSLQAFRASGVVSKMYNIDGTDQALLEVGEHVRTSTADALTITVDYEEGGANSPMTLYFAHRQGWSFDVKSISDRIVEHLRTTRKARYFVTTMWPELELEKPALAAYLSGFKAVALPSRWNGVRVFDLDAPGADVRPTPGT